MSIRQGIQSIAPSIGFFFSSSFFFLQFTGGNGDEILKLKIHKIVSRKPKHWVHVYRLRTVRCRKPPSASPMWVTAQQLQIINTLNYGKQGLLQELVLCQNNKELELPAWQLSQYNWKGGRGKYWSVLSMKIILFQLIDDCYSTLCFAWIYSSHIKTNQV